MANFKRKSVTSKRSNRDSARRRCRRRRAFSDAKQDSMRDVKRLYGLGLPR